MVTHDVERRLREQASEDQPAPSLLTKRRELWLLTAILLLGAVLRIINIGDQSLWIDEGFTYYAIKQPHLLDVLARDVHPPLYFAALKGWSALTGITELALRYFSVLPGMISIALIYQLAKTFVMFRPDMTSRAVPLLAALLMALAEMESFIAQEARSYTLHVMLAILSMLAFLRWIQHGRRLWAVTWAASLTLLVYTHYLGAWTGVVQGVYVLLFLRGRQRLHALGLLLIPAALFSVWLLAIVLPFQVHKADADATMDPSTFATLMNYAHDYLTQQWPLMLGLLLLGALSVTIDMLGRITQVRLRPIRGTVLLALWIVLPVLLTFLGNFRYSILTNYRVSQITPAIVLLWALGLVTFNRNVRLFLILVIMLYGVTMTDFYRPKLPWNDYGALAAEFIVPGDRVLMDFKGVDFSMEYYLDRNVSEDVDVLSLRRMVEWEPERFARDLPLLLADSPAVWVPRWNDSGLIFELMTQSGHVLTAHRVMDYGGNALEVYRFDQIREETPVVSFDNAMILRRFDIYPGLMRVDLWWETETGLQRDFTTSAFLLDQEGRLVAQYDSFPLVGERPTSTWNAGEVVYDPKPLVAVDQDSLPPGQYDVGVVIYEWTPNGTVRARTSDGQDLAIIGQLLR